MMHLMHQQCTANEKSNLTVHSLYASFYIAFAQRRYRFVLGLTTSLGTYLSVFPDAYDDAHIVCLAL